VGDQERVERLLFAYGATDQQDAECGHSIRNFVASDVVLGLHGDLLDRVHCSFFRVGVDYLIIRRVFLAKLFGKNK